MEELSTKALSLAQMLGLKAVVPYTNNKVLPLQAADPALLYGLELEIENVPNFDEMVVTGMTSVEDGSLRNYGREFLTKPATFSVVHNILTRFFEKNKLTELNYSERTSVHVHANCQDLTQEQIASVCLLYQVFEKLLYEFVGEERDKNIFCIPWDQTLLSYASVSNLLGGKGVMGLKSWQKYTGLNLLPLFSLGTMEFRHMAGTNDLNKISTWLNLIGSLFSYARKNTINEIKEMLVNLNTTSAYDDTTHRVFTYWTKSLTELQNYRFMLEEGVLNMKYSLLKAPEPATLYSSIIAQRAAAAPQGGLQAAGQNNIINTVAAQSTAAVGARVPNFFDTPREARLELAQLQAQIRADVLGFLDDAQTDEGPR